jgi:large subunit ribosomal protein L29
MKKKMMREKSSKELLEQLAEARLELAKLRAEAEIGTVKNPGRVRSLRKTIARLLTIIKQKKVK